MSLVSLRGWRILAGCGALGALAAAVLLLRLEGETHPDWRIAGRIHPVIVHFPIVLLLLVPLLELAGRWRPAWRDAAAGLLAVGAIGAYCAVAAGLALAYADGQNGPLVNDHLQGGVAVAAVATVAWMLRGGQWRRLYLFATWLTAAVLGWAAHQGGSLTHGEYYLTEGLPPGIRHALHLAEPPVPEIYPPDTVMGASIRPMLDRFCISCHGPAKQKGNYRMDTFALLVAGGATGKPVIMPGDPVHSEMLRRLRLPRGDKKAMPPEGQLRPSEAEMKLLEWWIAQGASRDLTLTAAVGRDSGFTDIFRAAPPAGVETVYLPRVGDYSALAAKISKLSHELSFSVVPLSKRPGDGLILRTRNHEASFDGAALSQLEPLAPFIIEAELAGTRIVDADLAELKDFVHLARLDLARTAVTGSMLEELAGLSELESINLCDSQLNDNGLARLVTLKSLRRLYVLGSPVTPAGLARFREMRPDCETP